MVADALARVCLSPLSRMDFSTSQHLTRRDFITRAGKAGAAASLLGFGGLPLASHAEKVIHPVGKAEHCIFVWLGGGMAQIDTFDPKRRGDGKKQAGSYYDAINTAVPGVQVCEHLPNIANLLDRFVL